MKRDYVMPPCFLSGKANITDYAANSTARRENPGAFLPNLVELGQEAFIVLNMPELAGVPPIFFEGPIRGRCYDEMNRLVRNPREVAGVA
jgi:hypothetical protein